MNTLSPAVGGHETDADLAAELGIGLSGLDGDCLVARVDEPDLGQLAAHQECVQMASMEAEGYLDSRVTEALGEEISAGQLAGAWLVEEEASHDGRCAFNVNEREKVD